MNGGIIRAPRPTRYEIVPAAAIEDSRISYRALGVLVRLLRLPDGASIAADDLAKGGGREGRTAIRSAIRELRAIGYVRQLKRQNTRGHWITERWVYDTPGADMTDDRKPVVGEPTVGKRVARSTKSTTTLTTEAARPRSPAASPKKKRGDQEMIAGIETWTDADRTLARTLVDAHSETVVQTAVLAVVARGDRPLPSSVMSELSNAVRAHKRNVASLTSPLSQLKERKLQLSKKDPKCLDDAFMAACDVVKKL